LEGKACPEKTKKGRHLQKTSKEKNYQKITAKGGPTDKPIKKTETQKTKAEKTRIKPLKDTEKRRGTQN